MFHFHEFLDSIAFLVYDRKYPPNRTLDPVSHCSAQQHVPCHPSPIMVAVRGLPAAATAAGRPRTATIMGRGGRVVTVQSGEAMRLEQSLVYNLAIYHVFVMFPRYSHLWCCC